MRDLYTCATALRSQNPHHSLHRLLPDQMAITSGEYPLEIFLLWIVSEILHHFYQRSIFLHLRLLNLLACIMSHNHRAKVSQITLSLSVPQSQAWDRSTAQQFAQSS